MTEISKKRISEILRRVFDLLWFEPDGLYTREILDHLSKNGNLSDYEKGYFSSVNRYPRYELIIRVGLIPFVKVGWLAKTEKGKWSITDNGRRESRKFSNPEEFFLAAIQSYEHWKNNGTNKLYEMASLVRDKAQEDAWEQIRKYLQSMPPMQLRSLAADLIRGLGHHVMRLIPPGKDNGLVHLIAATDPLGINGTRIIVHINQSGQAVTGEGLRAFMAVLGNSDHGLFISTGGFTQHVMDDACVSTNPSVALIDFERLIELWTGIYVHLSPEARARLPLKSVNFLSFTDPQIHSRRNATSYLSESLDFPGADIDPNQGEN